MYSNDLKNASPQKKKAESRLESKYASRAEGASALLQGLRPVHPGDRTKRKVNGKKAQFRTIKIAIYVTPDELIKLDQLAAQAGCQRAVFIRTLALGQRLSDQPKAITINDVRFARIMGALGEAGSLLQELLLIARVGDMPFAETIDLLVSRVEMAADAINPSPAEPQ